MLLGLDNIQDMYPKHLLGRQATTIFRRAHMAPSWNNLQCSAEQHRAMPVSGTYIPNTYYIYTYICTQVWSIGLLTGSSYGPPDTMTAKKSLPSMAPCWLSKIPRSRRGLAKEGTDCKDTRLSESCLGVVILCWPTCIIHLEYLTHSGPVCRRLSE